MNEEKLTAMIQLYANRLANVTQELVQTQADLLILQASSSTPEMIPDPSPDTE